MDFYHFHENGSVHYLIANVSLETYFKGLPTVANLIFTKPRSRMPDVGFSVFSGEQLAKYNIEPRHTVAYHSWKVLDAPWALTPVAKNDYLRIYIKLEPSCLNIKFRKNNCKSSKDYSLNYVSCYRDIYLALALDDPIDKQSMVLLNANYFNQWISMLGSNHQSSDLEMVRVVPSTKNYAGTTADVMEDIPTCTICLENKITVAFLPCGHATCCKPCQENYVKYETESAVSPSAMKRVCCPHCREEIDVFYTIKFTPRYKRCLACGCDKWEVIGGGRGGCGCVIGCYENSKDLKQCPACKKPVIEIRRVFILGDQP
ncbi:hypothetical protein AB6A40_004527 [Gnathostoma spinigerum]|uniref:RING-type domain-containing protein n=1 Tax=Gnathostoma spinigerum TaxID=75299 RepID=A0ABD6ELH4_9BILA